MTSALLVAEYIEIWPQQGIVDQYLEHTDCSTKWKTYNGLSVKNVLPISSSNFQVGCSAIVVSIRNIIKQRINRTVVSWYFPYDTIKPVSNDYYSTTIHNDSSS